LLKALPSSARSVSQACPVQEQVTQPPVVSELRTQELIRLRLPLSTRYLSVSGC
jgi:hypothetical protein